MKGFNLEIVNADELAALFARSPQIAGREIKRAIEKASNKILNVMVRNEPIDTGKLRQSTHINFTNDGSEIKASTDYAMFVHEGSAAVNGKLMAINSAAISPRARARLPGPNKNGMIFFRSRRAIPPNPFAERTIEEVKGDVQDYFEEAAQRIIDSV